MNARVCLAIGLGLLVAQAGCGSQRSQVPIGDDDDTGHLPDAGPGGSDAGAPPDAAPPYQPAVPPEVDGKIVINELMTSNALTLKDDTGQASDWVELYNPGSMDVPLRGYSFTDDLQQPRKAILSKDVTVRAHGYLVFFMDGNPAAGANHVGLSLSTQPASLALARPDGSYIDRVSYGKQETDFSAAREPDASDGWKIEWHPSPGTTNRPGSGQPIGAENPSAPPEQVPAAGDLSEIILGYEQLPSFALSVTSDNVARLLATPFEYVPALITYDGRTYGPVGVRLKGSNSFEPFDKKPSLKLSIDQYVKQARFFGMKDLTLNNMHSDMSMVHERLAYWVARQAGIPASRANHALLTVNGQFYGLYANIETVKKQMMERWFDDPAGPLFEGSDVDFLPPYVSQYQLESGPEDRTLIAHAAQALLNDNADAAIAAVSQYIDLDEFARFWAMCAVIAQFDSFPYSVPGDDYHLYADPLSGKLKFIPWGMDETFYSADFDVNQIHSVLAQKCKASPACYQKFVDQTWNVLRMTEQMDLEGMRDHVVQQIAPYVAMDGRKAYTDQDVAMYQDQLHWFITQRRTTLGTMIPPAGSN